MTKTDGPADDAPPGGRIDLLRRAWDKIAPTRYSDEKKRRLIWQFAAYVFLGECGTLPVKKEKTP